MCAPGEGGDLSAATVVTYPLLQARVTGSDPGSAFPRAPAWQQARADTTQGQKVDSMQHANPLGGISGGVSCWWGYQSPVGL